MTSRDNTSGIKTKSFFLRCFLIPGMVIQWFLYMIPFGGYSKVRQSTRLSRSPIICYLLSIISWSLLFLSIVIKSL